MEFPKKTRSANNARTLAGHYYFSQEIFEREQTQIFARHWNLLGHVADWSQPRSFHTSFIAAHPLITWKTPAGDLLTFHNVCRHRGAVLATSTCGRWERENCVCPYHGWSYDLQGRLAGAPSMADVENFDRDDWGLTPAATFVEQGLVYVCPNKVGAAIDPARMALAELMRPWNVEALVRSDRLEYEVAANWKVIFENYSECYHCPLVHPTLNRLTPYSESTNCFESGGVLGGPMRLAEGVATMSLDGGLASDLLPGLNATQQRLIYYFTVFPSCFISLHPDYVMVHRLVPLTPGTTRVICDFFTVAQRQLATERLNSAVKFWDQTNRQDWDVCERVQLGVSSPAYRPGPMSHLESIVAAFDRHYLQQLEGAPDGPPSR